MTYASKATALRFAGQMHLVNHSKHKMRQALTWANKWTTKLCGTWCPAANFKYSPQACCRSFNFPNRSAVLLVKSRAVTFRDCFLFACVCNLISCNNIVLSSHITTGTTLTSCLRNPCCFLCLKSERLPIWTGQHVCIHLILLHEIKRLVNWELGILPPSSCTPQNCFFSCFFKFWRGLVEVLLLLVLRPGFQHRHWCFGESLCGIMSGMCQFRFQLKIAFS